MKVPDANIHPLNILKKVLKKYARKNKKLVATTPTKKGCNQSVTAFFIMPYLIYLLCFF